MFNFYQAEIEAMKQIESQIISVKEESDLINNLETEMRE